jgi:peptide/nickel transport system permease protein
VSTAEVGLRETESRPETPRTGFRGVLGALRSDRYAMAGAVIVVLLIVVAAAAPLLTGIEGQDPDTYHDSLLNVVTAPNGPFGGVSTAHWLGVEPGTGRDMFARIVYGLRISLLVAVGACVAQVIVGVVLGLAAGLGGRFVDALLGRFIDLAIAFPQLVLGIALLAIVPDSFPRPLLVALVIAVVGWGGTARITRAQTLSLKTRDHVAAARLAGAKPWRIARREILPGLTAPVITYAALLLPGNIVIEAGLSFLGVGVRPPTPSLGQILSTATTWYYVDPMYVVVPAAVLFLTVLGFTLLADGVRTALDPRARRIVRGSR